MRVAFETPESSDRKTIETALDPVSKRFEMNLSVVDADATPRIIIMVSKFDHCLNHLVYQINVGWLRAEVAAVVSNHPDAKEVADKIDVPFFTGRLRKITSRNKRRSFTNCTSGLNRSSLFWPDIYADPIRRSHEQALRTCHQY
jgi:formyltetrahydrofolate hydrolase